MNRTTPKRSGFTLTELLVVVSILVIVTAVLTPMLTPVLAGREVREAARQVNAYFQNARARARELGRPVGVVIRRSTNDPNLGYQLSLAEESPPFTGATNLSRAVLTPVGPTAVDIKATLVLATGSPEPGSSLTLIQVNDYVRFSFRGPRYRIVSKDATGFVFTRTTDQPLPSASPSFPVPYEIFGRPRQTASVPLELPTGTALIMNLSGVGLSVSARGEVEPGLAPAVGVTEFQAPLQEIAAAGGDENNVPPLTIMFNAKGAVDRIYRVFPPAGTSPTWATSFPPKRPQSTIYLFVGRDAVPERFDNLRDATNLWITLDPQTGATNTAPNAVPPDLELLSASTRGAAAVAACRQLAASGQNVGGR